MKRLFLFLLVLFLHIFLYSQPITLIFTGQDSQSQYLQLNRAVITNVTQNWQETIYYPDTILLLQNNVSIDENESEFPLLFQLFQNNPNPFNGITDVNLHVVETGPVTLEITDVNGRIVKTAYTPSLQAGTHQFHISVANAGLYFLTAHQNGATSSIKMINNGGTANNIEYTGTTSTTPITTIHRGMVNNPYSIGDVMRYVGYSMVCGTLKQSQMVETHLLQSETIVLPFEVEQSLPTITTSPVINILQTSATSGGTVFDEGCGAVSARGICWNNTPHPTISDFNATNGSGTGTYSVSMTGLAQNETYYVRAFATNSVGTAYGNEISFSTLSCSDSLVTTTASICQGDSYSWRGNTYAASGIYADTVAKGDGCSILYQLQLSVNQQYNTAQADAFCPGSSYFWHGQNLTTTGIYTDTLTSIAGCDSIVTLTLTLHSTYFVTEYDTISIGNTLLWHGQSLTAEGIYLDTLSSVHGCDSICQLYLTVNSTCPAAQDVDGNTYSTKQYGSQCWMTENLRTTRYANNTSIPLGSVSSTVVAYRYNPNDNSNNVSTYGYLYNWQAVTKGINSEDYPLQGICPKGWHVPTSAEWNTLFNYMQTQSAYYCSYSSYTGQAMASSSSWIASTATCTIGYNLTSNNASGFNIPPAGLHHGYGGMYFGEYAYYWTATQTETTTADCIYGNNNDRKFYLYASNWGTQYGFSMRCIYGNGGELKVTTASAVRDYGDVTATCGGTVHVDGGDAVTARGICWSTSPTPTLSNCLGYTTDGTGIGNFTSTITGLQPATTYYVRAYATNVYGTIYGQQETILSTEEALPCPGTPTVTDVNGNTYQTVKIGSQCWMAENLRATNYANGTQIVYGGTNTSTGTGYYYYVNNSNANTSTYGLLYNWAAIMNGANSSSSNPSGIQGICPTGWHLPSKLEYDELTDYMQTISSYYCTTSSYIAKAMASTSGWKTWSVNCTIGNNQNTNNASNFNVYPSGKMETGTFVEFSENAYLWSCTQLTNAKAYTQDLDYILYSTFLLSKDKDLGCSVRCVKN
ncbi:MAG: T9SS type A sorting domain-containing protein [Bacteroidales bacterium]|nr:T9SS type A sorting domain-containing protein [Bacteroidales bacterium]